MRPFAAGSWLQSADGRTVAQQTHDGQGMALRNRAALDAHQPARDLSREGSHQVTRWHHESSFDGEQQWDSLNDELDLGVDFVDARHQPTFNVANETDKVPSERQAAYTNEIRERTEYEAENEAENRLFRTASAASWSDSANGSWHDRHSNCSSDNSWSGSSDCSATWSGVANSDTAEQFEEGVVRGSMEGVLERLIAPGAGQGTHMQRRWKSEMFVMLPESNVLKFWPQQQHGWGAQPPEAFFIELNSVSSVDVVSSLEFEIVYEGRRRLMRLRASTAEVAVAWVESLRRAAGLEPGVDEDMCDMRSQDEELHRVHDERERVPSQNERRKERLRQERQSEREEAAAWQIVEAAALKHLRAQEQAHNQEIAALDQIAATVFGEPGEVGVEPKQFVINRATTKHAHADRRLIGEKLSAKDVAQAEKAGLALKTLLAKADAMQQMARGQVSPYDRSVAGGRATSVSDSVHIDFGVDDRLHSTTIGAVDPTQGGPQRAEWDTPRHVNAQSAQQPQDYRRQELASEPEPEPEPEPELGPVQKPYSAQSASSPAGSTEVVAPRALGLDLAAMSPAVLASLFDELEADSGSSGTVSSVELLSVISQRFGAEAAAKAKHIIHSTAATTTGNAARVGVTETDDSVGGSTASVMVAAQSALDRAALPMSANDPDFQEVAVASTAPELSRNLSPVRAASPQLPLPSPSRRGPNMAPPYADRVGTRTAASEGDLNSWRQKSLSNHVDTLEAAAAASVARDERLTIDASRGFHLSGENGVPFLPSPPPLAPPVRRKPLTDAELRQVHLRQLQLREGASGLAPADSAVERLHGMSLDMLGQRAVGSAASRMRIQKVNDGAETKKTQAGGSSLSNRKAFRDVAMERAAGDLTTSQRSRDISGGDDVSNRTRFGSRREQKLEPPEPEPQPEPQPEPEPEPDSELARGVGLGTVQSNVSTEDSEEDSDSNPIEDDDEKDMERQALEASFRPIFDAMDQDESGLLEPDELRWPIGHAVERSIKLEVAAHDGTEKEIQLKIKLAIDLAVSELDRDGVGAVDFDDFVAWGSKNMGMVAQLATYFKLPFELPVQGRHAAGSEPRDHHALSKLPSSTVSTGGKVSGDAVPPPLPKALIGRGPHVQAQAREGQKEPLQTTFGEEATDAGAIAAQSVLPAANSVADGSMGVNSAIEERIRLMAQRRKAKARGMSFVSAS